jgi:hypothetical protein
MLAKMQNLPPHAVQFTDGNDIIGVMDIAGINRSCDLTFTFHTKLPEKE